MVPIPDFLVPLIDTANSHLVQWNGTPIKKMNKTWASSVRADAIPGLGDVAKSVVFFRKSGAGEGIRTLDPNLGKVVLYP